MARVYQPLDEYLSQTNDVTVLSRLGEIVNKYIEYNFGSKHCYAGVYYLPKYYIEEIDFKTGKLKVKKITYKEVSTRYEQTFSGYKKYVTFKPTIAKKISELSLKVDKHNFKIGTQVMGMRSFTDNIPFDPETCNEFEKETYESYS